MPNPSRWLLLRTRSGRRVDEALNYGAGAAQNQVRVLDSNQFPIEWNDSQFGDFVMGILDKSPALVLSQNCDIATKDYVQIAPIIQVDPEDIGKVGRLKSHAILDSFYLAPHPPQWEGDAYADFELMQSVHKSYLKSIPSGSHFRISAPNVLVLQGYITRYFGRPNAYDANADKVPRDGTYMCIACFYHRGIITSVSACKDDTLSCCEKCGGTGWVPKLDSIPGA